MNATVFGQAYHNGLQRTISFLLSCGVPNDSAQEIAQSAWARGWERLGQLRNDKMIIAWVNAIAINQFRRTLRATKREEPWTAAHGDTCTTQLNWAKIDMGRILESCSKKDRALLKAQLLGITTKELANKEGVTETAIRIRLLRARRSARQLCQPAAPLMSAA